jgi:hypothetical protein
MPVLQDAGLTVEAVRDGQFFAEEDAGGLPVMPRNKRAYCMVSLGA